MDQDTSRARPSSRSPRRPAVLDSFASRSACPTAIDAGAMTGPLRVVVDAADLTWATPLSRAPSTANLLKLPLDDTSFDLPARTANVSPSSGQFYVQSGTQWFGRWRCRDPTRARAELGAARHAKLRGERHRPAQARATTAGTPCRSPARAGPDPSADDFSKALGLPAGTQVKVDDVDELVRQQHGIDPGTTTSRTQTAQYASVKALLRRTSPTSRCSAPAPSMWARQRRPHGERRPGGHPLDLVEPDSTRREAIRPGLPCSPGRVVSGGGRTSGAPARW